MRVSIIGAGYVGLVTGVCLAEKGHEVVCVDVDRSKVERLTRGEAPIYEVGLGELLERHAGKGFSATTDLVDAVRDSEVTFIAVGTPFDGAAIDLTYVLNAARQVGAALVEKSRACCCRQEHGGARHDGRRGAGRSGGDVGPARR